MFDLVALVNVLLPKVEFVLVSVILDISGTFTLANLRVFW